LDYVFTVIACEKVASNIIRLKASSTKIRAQAGLTSDARGGQHSFGKFEKVPRARNVEKLGKAPHVHDLKPSKHAKFSPNEVQKVGGG